MLQKKKKKSKYKTPFDLSIYQKWLAKQERKREREEAWTSAQHLDYKRGLRNIKKERRKYGTPAQWDYVSGLFEITLDVYKGKCYEDLDEWLIRNKEMAEQLK